MHGIHATFEGRLGREAELRTAKKGKPWLSFSLAVDTEGEEDALTTTWVRVAYFGEDAESLVGRLRKGVGVYCEGRLRLDTWTTQEGVRRSGLSIVAWQIVPLGQIGKKRPKAPHKRGSGTSAGPVLTPDDAIPSRRMESRRQRTHELKRPGLRRGTYAGAALSLFQQNRIRADTSRESPIAMTSTRSYLSDLTHL
jgi:single-strand DNA-binding protein